MRAPRPTTAQRLAFDAAGLGISLALLWALIAAGCGESTPQGSSPAAAPAAAPARLDGLVRLSDAWLKVGPHVGHEPRMDLSPQCRAKRDVANKAGEAEVPLCFDETPRARGAIDRVRVEIHRSTSPAALRRLAAADEGAHFIVERNGSTYQLLDLAYAVRRDGGYREGEIRVLSATPDAADALVGELARLFPGAAVDRVERPLLPTPPKPAPGKDGAP
ncbi:MAG: hypothetical protein CSA66_06485 [Proteobacteria bacterium]|nr:MAG: hypothetical protein CSA66_06485 [Pseudomonadota bacterium]